MTEVTPLTLIRQRMETFRSSFVGVARNEVKTVTAGAMLGVFEATRTLELLTLGAYYRTSSTAFVTLTTRVAASCSHQVIITNNL